MAARRTSTYRIRWWAVLFAMVGSFFTLFFIFIMGPGRGAAGGELFRIQTCYALGLCLLAWVFFTSDSLSQERRERTLGLLFLTDLRGYDVVLGKFIATSLNALYGLVALFPITAVPLLIGGVTGSEFWRMALALTNALFVSLAAGFGVSCFVQDQQRSMGWTFGLIALLAGGLPALTALSPPFISWLQLAGPTFPFSYAVESRYITHRNEFWLGLIISHLLGWFFLLVASILLPRTLQEKSTPRTRKSFFYTLLSRSRGGGAAHARRRQTLLSSNPVTWLILEEPVLSRIAWFVVALCGFSVFLSILTTGAANPHLTVQVAQRFGFILKLLVAIQACRFFLEARRSGAMELLLCTPLSASAMIKGQTAAVRRLFFWPCTALLLLHLAPTLVLIDSAMTGSAPNGLWHTFADTSFGFANFVWYTLNFLADIFAAVWFGMWLALSMKKPGYAPVATIFFVLVLFSIPFCPLDLVADLIFIRWATVKLTQDFRRVLDRHAPSPALLRVPPRPHQFSAISPKPR